MTTPASPSEDHYRRRRRLATGNQTNDTVTGWGGLGVAHSALPLPAREPDGTFHQVRYSSVQVQQLKSFEKWEITLQLGTVSRVRLQCSGKYTGCFTTLGHNCRR